VLLRLIQRRPWLHRVAGRTILIGDIPWVAQSVEAFVSKCFALSFSISTVSVASANPIDHLLHRHTHRWAIERVGG
jgi:ABC-type Zn2+ transport system substrate-binding protein/surface adhesin